MFRYLTLSSGTASVLAGLVALVLACQAITPTIVYGMSDAPEETQTQTTEESTPFTEEAPLTDAAPANEETVIAEAEVLTEPKQTPPETPPAEDVSIATGDAVAGLTSDTDINETEVDTSSAEEPEIVLEEVAATEPLPEPPPEPDASPELSVSATNTATTATNATTTATTGENTASGGGEVTISSGDAIAYADVLNVVNTNIVDSNGLVAFVNDTLGYDNFDLRDEFELTYAKFDTSQTTPSCTLDACADGNTQVNLSNTASIDNDVTVIANTGDNEASGENVSITTGDAYASANIINVANTNIVDSNYLLLVFNNFSSYAGDIVLPNSNFFDNILSSGSGVNNTEVDITNSATINNSVDVVANTGDNEASGDNASIDTGAAGSLGLVSNTVNQNIIGGTAFSMLIRVEGDWTGTITGLPDGLTWRETERGIEIVSRDIANGLTPTQSLTKTTINNSADINNNVKVYALTGNNKASGDEAEINTGNAYADSSILNIANTNVISSNWTNLIFTIYGNWSGNLTFGQPDLWLGVTAESTDQPIMPGSQVTYTFTVFNHGDVTAPNVTLESLFETGALAFADPGVRGTSGGNTLHDWSLGDIAAGETREISYTARVSEQLERGVVSAIPLTSRVFSTQNDANEDDNEDVVTIYVGKKRENSNSRHETFPAHFDIGKIASQDFAQPGDTIDYTITFFNRGGPLYDALLVDTMQNEAGEIIQQQSWPFDEIKNWETITVKYSMKFDPETPLGTYTNSAQLIGFHESRVNKYQMPYESSIARHILQLGAEGMVLGASDSFCSPYLTQYLRYGSNNDTTQVMRLQQFLNDHLHLSIPVSGFFGQATEQGVRDFQNRYRDDVLTPWGLTRDSGYVYYTTQKKINELMCNEEFLFPLNLSQQEEIESYRNQVQPSAGDIGLSPEPATLTERFGFNTGTAR